MDGQPTPAVGEDRIRPLDGLRGAAILLVLFNHLLPNINYAPSRAFQWFSNLAQSGWVGVDLFFVLSGYLITGILIRAKSKERFFRTFYARRVLRIFPLYYFALFLTFVVFPLLPIVDWESFRPVWRGQLWSWLYATNLGVWLQPGHFTSAQVNLGHFWSLAVEEHFYLVWPAVVYFLPVRRITWLSLGCVLLTPLMRTTAVYVWDAPHAFFHQTFCRADALAFGALVASLRAEGLLDRLKNVFLVLGGAALIVLAGLFLHWRCLGAREPLMHSVGYTLIGLAATSSVVLAIGLKERHWLSRAVGCGFLRFFGRYSYGLYVIHGLIAPALVTALPAAAFIEATGSVGWGGLTCALARIAPCVALSLVSWYLLEQPCLRLKHRFEYVSRPPQGVEDEPAEPSVDCGPAADRGTAEAQLVLDRIEGARVGRK
jgi:peptidoglycan/LPS O-acetylase OafA/YrhL